MLIRRVFRLRVISEMRCGLHCRRGMSRFFRSKEDATVSSVSSPTSHSRTVFSMISPLTAHPATGLEFGLERVEPGAEIPQHSHESSEEVVFIVSGRARAYVGSEEKEVKAGEAVFLPIRTPHRIVNLEQHEPLWITYTFSPPVGLKLANR